MVLWGSRWMGLWLQMQLELGVLLGSVVISSGSDGDSDLKDGYNVGRSSSKPDFWDLT